MENFPKVIVTLLQFHGLWPKQEFATVSQAVKVLVFYCFSGWIFSGTMLYLLSTYVGKFVTQISSFLGKKQPIFIETTNSVCINCAVVFVEGIYFVYSFSLFLANLNDIVHLTKKLQSFEEFGEPRDLASFKNRQNKLMKFLYVNSVGRLLGYSAWSYLEEPTCRGTSFDQYRRETCGVLVPIWVPFSLDNPLVKNVVLVVQTFHIVISVMCAITATCFIITCIDLITLKMYLNENLESVKELPQEQKKDKLVWCVNYHVHIIG
jgi:hypothetical protein